MAGRDEGRDIGAQLEAIERRLERLERLAFLGFQDTRDVAEYVYQSVITDPDCVKRLSWTQRSFRSLDDGEALNIGITLSEIAELKQAMRVLRKQTRLDVLGIFRDMVRRARSETKLEKAA